MADLTIVTSYTCATNINWITSVVSDTNPNIIYQVRYGILPMTEQQKRGYKTGYTCTCPANKFRSKTCKHIIRANGDKCGWNMHMETRTRPKNGRCPDCGGPIEAFDLGV